MTHHTGSNEGRVVPVPIDPATGEPYTLTRLDELHAYAGLHYEWQASARRAEIVALADPTDGATT